MSSLSKTSAALSEVTPEQARATVHRLIEGYQDKSGSGYPRAKHTTAGCLIAQKAGNRDENAYIQIAPIVVGSTTRGTTPKAKPPPQGAHRLAVVGYKP